MKVHERDGLKRGGASRRGRGSGAGRARGGALVLAGVVALFGSLAANHGTVQAGSLPGPAVGIASGDDVDEGDPAVFTLTRDGADTDEALTVHVSVTQRGDALGTPVPMTVTFAAASTTVELVLPTVDDAVDEVDAVVTVTLVAGTDDYHVVDGLGDSATVTVADNDLPEVSITSAGGVTEGEAAVFTLTRIGVTNDALTVNVSVTQSGDALGGQIPPVAFAANATTTELSVGTVDDAVDEVDAVVTATLAPGTGYRVVAAPGNRATVTVADNDLPEVSIASAGNVTEGEAAVFTLTRSGVTSDPLTVNVSVTQSGDALGSPIPPVAFAPNAATTELSLGTVDDAVDEEDAVVTVTLMAGTGYRVVDGLGDRATVTVADNDLPEVSIASAGNVTEGEAAVFTLTRSGVTSDALTVNVSVTQSGNTLGGQIPPVAFAANATTTELSVGTVDDAVDAADNMVTATLAPGTGYNVVDGLGDRATVTVADNDLPEVSITSAGGVTEGEAAVFTLTRSGVTSDALTVNVSVTQSGNTLGGPIPPVAFAANATTTELSVGTVDDAVDAADNMVTATVAPGTGYNVVAAPGNRATVTVADNDLPEVSIASAGNVTEGEAAVFTLTRSGVTTDALTVNVSVSQRGDALGAPVPATATFAADGATAELSVPTVDDAVDEEDAVVTAALAAGGYRIAAAPGDRATVTVADNDLPEVSIASAGGVTEGEAAVFTLTRSGVTTDALTVNVSVTQRGDALGAPVPTTATFAPNGATAELAVPTVDDAVDEEPAVVTATLEAGTGSYRIAAAPGNRATVTVADNDLPEVSIASAGGVTEGEAAVFTLTRSGVTTDALTVNVSVSQRGEALGAPVPTTATFAADDATAELAVPTVDDAVGEVDAVVTATLAPGTGYNVVAAPGDRATVTVADNDLPEVSIASAGNVTEGEAAVFTLTRSGVTSDPLTVNVSVTQSGDALGGRIPPVAFAPNAATTELSVGTVDDAVDEVDAVVTATLAPGTGYNVVDGPGNRATVTVADNDLPEVSITSAGNVTEGEAAVFTLTRSGVTSDPLTVNVSVTQSGLTLGGRIPPVAFAPNAATTELSVGTVDDAVDEVDAVVTATLAPGTGYNVVDGPGNRATVTVADNDFPEVSIASAGGVTEGEAAVFTLTRSGVTSDPLTVNVSVTQSGNTLGSRIPPVAFAANATTTELSVGTVDDAVDAADNVVTATVAPGTGYRVVAAPGDRATVTVADNDLPEVSIASAGNVTEGEAAVFTLTRIGVTTDPLTVNVSVTQRGDALGAPVPATATFAPNGATAELAVPTVDDAVDEEDAVVTAALAAGGYRIAAAPGDRATVTVADNDLPEVSIAAAGGVTEGEPAVFTLTRIGLTDDALTVDVSVNQRGDVLGSLHPGRVPPVVFAPNAATAELSVPTVDDAVDEEPAVVTATLEAGTGGYRIAAAPGDRATVTVADNDGPEVSIASAGGVTEGEPAVFTLTRSGLTDDALTVNVSVSQSGDALGGPVPTTAFFAANGATAEISVPTVDDEVDEEDAVVTATLAAGAGYDLAATPGDRATVTVADNDLPEVSIASAGGVTEGEAAVFTLTRSGVTSDPLTVNVSVTQSGNTLGSPIPPVAFAANATTTELAVPTVDDEVHEVDEVDTVTATLAPGTGYRVVASPGDRATVTVADNDGPAVSFEASTYVVAEGERVTVRAVLSGPPGEDIVVPLTIVRGDGLTDEDFSGVPSSLVFAEGETEASFVLIAHRDRLDEEDEVVELRFFPKTVPAGEPALVTLRDTFEPAVSFEESTYVVAEGKSVTVRAVLSGPPGEDTDVPLTIVRGDGLTDEDFSGVPSSLFFAAGEMEASFVLAALPDQLDEEDEIIELRFFPKTVPAGEPALVTLRDTFEPDSREQRNRVAGEYVPGLGGTLAGIVTQTLGGRLAQPGLPRGDRLAIGGHEVRLAANDIDAAVGGTFAGASHDTMPARADRFAMSLGAAGDGDRAGGSGHGWAIWAEGAGTGFSDDDGDLAIDGTVVSGAGGIEHAGGDWLGGLALFHSRARAVYEMPLLGERLSDDIEAHLTSAIPYLRWSPDAATTVWGAAGHGRGQMTLSDSTGAYETDIEMTMGAFGASRRVLSEGFDLAVKSDAFWTRITSDETEDLDQVKDDGYRLRAGVEGGLERRLGNGARLRPSLEAGVRKDGGDTGARGTGLEVGGGIAYEDPGLGLTAEASGRVLLLHSNEGYEEWGVAGRLRLEPGSDGRGLWFALEPNLGAAASGASRVWQDGRFGSPTGEWTAQGRVALSLGYAMPVFEPAGRLTPHARMTFNDDGSQHYGAGFDLTLGPDFVLGLQTVHRFDNDSEPSVQLTSTLRW